MLQSVRNYLSLFKKPDEKILKTIEETDRKNFMDENKELNEKTPGEMAEINLDLRRNKLLELIEFIAKS